MKQIIIAGIVSLLVAIFTTPVLISFFQSRKWGQEIRPDGPQSHHVKRGVPTMGGVAILFAIWVGYICAHLIRLPRVFDITATGIAVLSLATALAIVGFIDDFIKVSRHRNLGLSKKSKFLGQFIVAVTFAIIVLHFPNSNHQTLATAYLSYVRDILAIAFPWYIFLIFVWIVISAWSNAVNFTDGLDGLVAGCAAMVFGSYVIISFWQFRNGCTTATAPTVHCYQVRDPLDLAIIAAAAGGACLGFLWWNAAPAKIIMGDTGSLAIGGLIAGISITSSTELLMVIIGALFVAEMISVIVQIISFRTTGRRVFRMAPFHHHFELSGWAETSVTIRFWLLTALSCVSGLALFYSEFQPV